MCQELRSSSVSLLAWLTTTTGGKIIKVLEKEKMTDLLTESEFGEVKPYSNALPKFHVKFTPQKHVQQTTFISPKSRKIFPRYLNMLYCMGWFLGGPPTPQRMYTQRTTMSPPLLSPPAGKSTLGIRLIHILLHYDMCVCPQIE